MIQPKDVRLKPEQITGIEEEDNITKEYIARRHNIMELAHKGQSPKEIAKTLKCDNSFVTSVIKEHENMLKGKIPEF